MKRKKCPKCGKKRTVSMFYNNRAKKDGLSDHCKDCQKEYSSNYYWNNVAARAIRAAF